MDHTYASVSRETSLILVTHTMGNESQLIGKKLLPVCPKTVVGKEKKKKENKDYCKAFHVTRNAKTLIELKRQIKNYKILFRE